MQGDVRAAEFWVNVEQAMSLDYEFQTEQLSHQTIRAAEVVQLARDQGNPYASRAVAITRPRVRVDLTSLSFERGRPPDHARQVRFESGTLKLKLIQEVLYSDALSECERNIWQEHEDHHVQDNRDVMARLEAQLAADDEFNQIMIERRWYPLRNSADFSTLQGNIRARVGAVFQRLTGAAVVARDTEEEYRRVQQSLESCRGGSTP